jgi:hypothetical protein
VLFHGYFYVVRVAGGCVSSQAPHAGADPKLLSSLAERPELILAVIHVRSDTYGNSVFDTLNHLNRIIEYNATT